MKNNNRIRRAGNRIFVGKQQSLLDDRDYLTLKLKSLWAGKEPIRSKIHAQFKFYFKDFYNKKGTMNLKLGDLDNIICMPSDCLQHAGILANDALIMSLDGSRKLQSNTGQNYIEIVLKNFDS